MFLLRQDKCKEKKEVCVGLCVPVGANRESVWQTPVVQGRTQLAGQFCPLDINIFIYSNLLRTVPMLVCRSDSRMCAPVCQNETITSLTLWGKLRGCHQPLDRRYYSNQVFKAPWLGMWSQASRWIWMHCFLFVFGFLCNLCFY